MGFDHLDPFNLNKQDPQKKSWDEVFAKPSKGGVPGRSKRSAERNGSEENNNQEEAFIQDEKVSDPPPPPKPNVVLFDPKWDCSEGFFEEKVTASVQCKLPDESQHLTRVTFSLFAVPDGGKPEKINSMEAYIQAEKAFAELTLSHPQFKDAQGEEIQTCDFIFKAKHRDSREMESEPLPVRFKNEEKKQVPHKASYTSGNEIHITFDPAHSTKVLKCDKIVHVQFNRRTIDGVMIMPSKVNSVFAFKDKLANSNGWTVDCLQSEKTPDYQQGTGVGSKGTASVPASMYDAPSLSTSLFAFYDPVKSPTGVKKYVISFHAFAYAWEGRIAESGMGAWLGNTPRLGKMCGMERIGYPKSRIETNRPQAKITWKPSKILTRPMVLFPVNELELPYGFPSF